ncbi:MAG TPA: RNA-splicing ligase RtcB [Bdellovibrionales bacterium]|nr:RNA-splicing ligase RtcB [Bdellovibrionales bacterium]
MKVAARIYATEALILKMDQKVYEQLCHVAMLPGIVDKAYAMPDAHWGYGFPIGGVAAFDPDQGGIISAGGVGFDISCGVRLLHAKLKISELTPYKEALANLLYKRIPSGTGSRGKILLSDREMNDMLMGGARWAVDNGHGTAADLDHTEERGQMPGANPEMISQKAKDRQREEMGTLGSGNHYLEVQEVKEIFHRPAAEAMGLELNDVVISIHCGSRGLGHQIGTDYLRSMVTAAKQFQIYLPDRELACVPLHSTLGESYLGAMRGAINCALANRQIITHLVREAFTELIPNIELRLVYDVSHNTCKSEWHDVNGKRKKLFVHRKGATRAYGPGHEELPERFKAIGQPVFIGGNMAVGSFVLVGTNEAEALSFSSDCHGAGRAMSRTEAKKLWNGPDIIRDLREQGILIRSGSYRGVAEEAPLAYKDLREVVDAAEKARLALKVAQLSPHICVKG